MPAFAPIAASALMTIHALGLQTVGLDRAQAPASAELRTLQAAVVADSRTAETKFWAARQARGPLVESIPGAVDEVLVTFLWRGDDSTRSVQLYGGLPAARYYPWSKTMQRIPDTHVWYRSERIPTDARFQYAFTVNAPELDFVSEADLVAFAKRYPRQADPLNPQTMDGQSCLELSDAPSQPYLTPVALGRRGSLRRDSLWSARLSEVRRITVYLPVSVSADKPDYPLVVQFDGEWWSEASHSLPVILDNLIDQGRIPPFIAVLVDNQGTRDRDLPNSAAFADFVALELLPWLRERYPVTRYAARAIVSGASNGGLAAGYTGLRHSNAFGNVLALSGWWFHHENNWGTNFNTTPTWRNEPSWIIREFALQPRLPLRFFLDVGRFDVYYDNALTMNRHMRDVLIAKGYPLVYKEYNGGHDGITMRGSIAIGLVALAGSWQW